MKKAKIFLASLAIVGIVGGAVASKFAGIPFFTTLVYGQTPTSSFLGNVTTSVVTSASYYYYTTVGATPAYYYSIIKINS